MPFDKKYTGMAVNQGQVDSGERIRAPKSSSFVSNYRYYNRQSIATCMLINNVPYLKNRGLVL